MSRYLNALRGCGIEVNLADYSRLDEAAELRVADAELTGMMKFITDKYNSLDFGEIEKSAGDIYRFKYQNMILENARTLDTIYEASPDPGAKKYREVTTAIMRVMEHLAGNREAYSTLYKTGNGLVQLMYTSLVAACLYATGTLVSNTIRFVTTEKDTECSVLFDEIPGTVKHVHIKNILAAANDLNAFNTVLAEFSKSSTRRTMQESVTLGGVSAVVLAVGGIILLIPKVIVLIREIIYSVYYSRVKTAEMLEVQAELLRTNIESLERGRGDKKVIARQKKIAQKLETWKNRVALKMDSTEALKNTQMKKENASLRLDRNSPLMQSVDSAEGLLI